MWKIFVTISCFTVAVLARNIETNNVQNLELKTTDTYGRCPKGFHKVKTDCYQLSRRKANWDDADMACRDKNSTLAVLPNAEITRYFKTYLMTPKFKRVQRWIGVRYNPISKIWVSGRLGEEIPYNDFWKKNFKRNLNWTCAVATPNRTYEWAPKKCYLRRHYVCQIPLNPPHAKIDVIKPELSILSLTGTETIMRDPSKPQDRNPPRKKTDSRLRDPTKPQAIKLNPIKPQAIKPDPTKPQAIKLAPLITSEILKRSTVKRNEVSKSNYQNSNLRHGRKSGFPRTRWAPGTKSSDRQRLIRSKNVNEPDQWVPRRAAIASQKEIDKDNHDKPFTENYRTGPRTLVERSSGSIFELNRHPKVDSSNEEVLLKTQTGKGVSYSR